MTEARAEMTETELIALCDAIINEPKFYGVAVYVARALRARLVAGDVRNALDPLHLESTHPSNAYYNLGGAIADIEHTGKCDAISLRTLKRVEKQLGETYAALKEA